MSTNSDKLTLTLNDANNVNNNGNPSAVNLNGIKLVGKLFKVKEKFENYYLI